MFSKLKTRKKIFSSIEAMICLFIISIVVMTYILKYNLKSDVAPRKEINALMSDLRTTRGVAMNSGRSINFKFGKKSYFPYDTATTDTTTTYSTVTGDLKHGEIQTGNDRKKDAFSFDNLDARISKSADSTRFQTIYYTITNKKYRTDCYIITGRMNVDEIKK